MVPQGNQHQLLKVVVPVTTTVGVMEVSVVMVVMAVPEETVVADRMVPMVSLRI
jgi:hypothetical protein